MRPTQRSTVDLTAPEVFGATPESPAGARTSDGWRQAGQALMDGMFSVRLATARLHKACASGDEHRVCESLATGANPNAFDAQGDAALHHLAQGSCRDPSVQRMILGHLSKAGADLDLPARHRKRSEQHHPVERAAAKGQWPLVFALMKRGASVKRTLHEKVENPVPVVCHAIWNSDLPVEGVRAVIRASGPVIHTALFTALFARSLGEDGEDPGTRTKREQRLAAIVEALIQEGASVLSRKPLDECHMTDVPLYVAVWERWGLDVIDRLLEAGAWSREVCWTQHGPQVELMNAVCASDRPEVFLRLEQEGLGRTFDTATWDEHLHQVNVRRHHLLDDPVRKAGASRMAVLIEQRLLAQAVTDDPHPETTLSCMTTPLRARL